MAAVSRSDEHGFCVRATRDFTDGHLILQEQASEVVLCRSQWAIEVLPGGWLIKQASEFKHRPMSREQTLRLVLEHCIDTEESSGLYKIASFINHSCDPNCVMLITGPDQVSVYARCAISKGDELTISYIGDFCILPREYRQLAIHRLRDPSFECWCEKCVGDASAEPNLSQLFSNLSLIEDPQEQLKQSFSDEPDLTIRERLTYLQSKYPQHWSPVLLQQFKRQCRKVKHSATPTVNQQSQPKQMPSDSTKFDMDAWKEHIMYLCLADKEDERKMRYTFDLIETCLKKSLEVLGRSDVYTYLIAKTYIHWVFQVADFDVDDGFHLDVKLFEDAVRIVTTFKNPLTPDSPALLKIVQQDRAFELMNGLKTLHEYGYMTTKRYNQLCALALSSH